MVQHLKTLLNGDQELRPLLAKARFLSDLQSQFISITPPDLAQSGQIQVLGLRLGMLSIAAANASVAAKLRQLAPEMAVLMRGMGHEVSGIRVKVQVSYDRHQAKPSPRLLSKTAQKTLVEFSRTLHESPLKLALEKMAKSNS